MIVIKSWFSELPLKMQSVVISAQRGPDSAFCPQIKKITKWIRRTCQENADPAHTFMANDPLPTLEEMEYELEFSTLHYVNHFVYGLEVIAYKHPEIETRDTAMYYYEGIVTKLFHYNIETETDLDRRLSGRAYGASDIIGEQTDAMDT